MSPCRFLATNNAHHAGKQPLRGKHRSSVCFYVDGGIRGQKPRRFPPAMFEFVGGWLQVKTFDVKL
tara:strand:- start:300 stop:497 length:198 start_codon:yes stop_codon:yes gene_type:complete